MFRYFQVRVVGTMLGEGLLYKKFMLIKLVFLLWLPVRYSFMHASMWALMIDNKLCLYTEFCVLECVGIC